MQLPFLNFGFQQLNNSLVAEQQQQQANHLVKKIKFFLNKFI